MAYDSALESRVQRQDEIITVLRREIAGLRRSAGADRQVAARYGGLLGALDGGFCVVQAVFEEAGAGPVDYRFQEVNLAFERQTGLKTAVGRTLRELIPGRYAGWPAALGQVTFSGEAGRFELPAGMLYPYRGGCAFRVGAADQHMVGILFDDPAVHAREEAAERDAASLQVRFLATLAHELRNPLAPLQSGIDVLRMARERSPGGAAAEQQVLEIMSRQLGQLAHLLDELLDVAEISGGTVTLKRRRVDLADAIRCGIELADGRVRAGQRRLSVDLPSEALAVDGDPGRLAQVVASLLDNAAKFTGEAGRIRLTARRRGCMARVTVEDDGVGIDPDMLEEIFGMFSRTRTDRHGLGLGLYVVRDLVSLHGGTVEARSEGRGRGSQFIVELPLSRGTRSPPAQPELRAVERRRMLVVDDNRDAADSLAVLLRSLGGEVQTAYEGRTALLLLDEFQPQLVFLDLGMPEMDGYEVARLIRRREAGDRVVLVAVTGWGQPGDRRHTAEAGFDDHLLKPATFEDLRRIVETRHLLR